MKQVVQIQKNRTIRMSSMKIGNDSLRTDSTISMQSESKAAKSVATPNNMQMEASTKYMQLSHKEWPAQAKSTLLET